MLKKAFLALRFVGIGGIWRAVRYSLRRDRWERRFRDAPPGPPQPPGEVLESRPRPGGWEVSFQNAHLEVRFLVEDLVRITWQPGELPPSYALARREWPEVPLQQENTPAGVRLQSLSLEVEVRLDGGLLFRDRAGRLLRQDLPPERHGQGWLQRAVLRPEERIYGLGERAASLNRRGGTFRMWNRDPGGTYGPGDDPLYLCLPLYIGLHREGSVLLFFENPFPATFSFREEAQAHFEDGALRYYLIPGPMQRALARYGELTGRPPLPPRWALGYHQSRWGYRSAAEVRQVVAEFEAHDLPLSAVHLDLDYMEECRVFTISRERFPDMAGLTRELAEKGIRLVAILDPGVQADPGNPLYTEGLERGAFCTLPDGRTLQAPVWPGWCAFPDLTDPQVRAWWGAQYRRLLEAGIAGIWHDMNEPAVFAAWGEPTLPRATRHALEGRGGDHRQAHNLYGLLLNQVGAEAIREGRPGGRPFLLSRSGWAGLQRYAWTWTGDTASTWAGLRLTVPTVLGLSLSGIPYSGPDIGGFEGNPSPELWLRWFQLAAFLPFFRTHSARGTSRREPWCFGPACLAIARRFLQLRQALLPYLYTLAWQAHREGTPLIRPLFWPEGGDPALWDVDDAFFLGDALLVAPVLEEGVRRRRVHLPAGLWYDFWEDTPREGGQEVDLPAPLERIPLLVRAGSVLPLEEEGQVRLHLYPPQTGLRGGGLLYSDAGDGEGEGCLERFTLEWEEEDLRLHREVSGAAAPPERPVHLHGGPGRPDTLTTPERRPTPERPALGKPAPPSGSDRRA